MTYNLSFMEQPSIFGIFQGINVESGYWFAIMILVSLYIILMISFKNYDTKITMLVTPFLVLIVAGSFWGLGLLKMEILRWFIVLFIGSIVVYLASGDK